MDQDLSVREAADILAVSTRTLRTYLKAGKFPGARQVEGRFGPEHRIPSAEVYALREETGQAGREGQGFQAARGANGQESTLGSVTSPERPADGGQDGTIPVRLVMESYQRTLRDVGKLQHQIKQLKSEIAHLQEELQDRETLLAVLQERSGRP